MSQRSTGDRKENLFSLKFVRPEKAVPARWHPATTRMTAHERRRGRMRTRSAKIVGEMQPAT